MRRGRELTLPWTLNMSAFLKETGILRDVCWNEGGVCGWDLYVLIL